MIDPNPYWVATRALISAGILSYAVIRVTEGVGPLRLLGRCNDYIRAIGFLAAEMAAGAWVRRDRWQECKERVRWQR